MRRDLSARLVWLAAAGLLGGVAAAWIVSMAGPVRAAVPSVPFALSVMVLVGWSLICSGLLALRSQSASRLGAVLIFTGFAWFASTLADAHNPVLLTVGETVYPFYYAGFLYLILSFPAGRLQGRLDRALMVAALGLVTLGQWAWLLFADSRAALIRLPGRPARGPEAVADTAAWRWPRPGHGADLGPWASATVRELPKQDLGEHRRTVPDGDE